ncbi:hypothetical protein Gohar_022510 [Gossypium harknessii]|uniref:Uncharacterized protein n=1 Tax=Gossypium harknessii TaxID=34285 RepID=A0A7J9HA62_9ROSI|nr:hypothetical protein [Gossypium harknessii]
MWTNTNHKLEVVYQQWRFSSYILVEESISSSMVADVSAANFTGILNTN